MKYVSKTKSLKQTLSDTISVFPLINEKKWFLIFILKGYKKLIIMLNRMFLMTYFLKNKLLILKIIQIVIENTLLNLVLVKGLTPKHSKNGMKIAVAVNA